MFATNRLLATLAIAILPGLSGIQSASAGCPPNNAVRYVGNTALDSECTDNDIQSAINNSTSCPTTIFISNERAWIGQHLDINNKNLTMVGRNLLCGGNVICDDSCAPMTPNVVIDGAGHTGDSVIYVHGTSNVTLQYLRIRNGYNINGAANTYGGGIHFDGQGSLVLDTTWVDANTARYGGGINFNGNGGFAELKVLSNTRILNNTAANSGGGVQVTGNALMSILHDNTAVWLNHAPNGVGGGINVVGPARADIASPGLSNIGVIYSNDAQRGGGLAITGGSSVSEVATVRLFTVDPMRAVRIQGNFASTSGGGIYLKPYVGTIAINIAELCAYDFRIDQNAAPEGSAIQLDSDSDLIVSSFSSVELNYTPASENGCSGLPAISSRCATGVQCNEISDNVNEDANSTPTLGAAIQIAYASVFGGDRFSMSGNVGGYAIRSDNFSRISNCVIAGNDVSRQLLRGDSGQFGIDSCTLAGNTILSTNSIYSGGPLTLTRTIIDQPGNNALGYGGSPSDLSVSYVLSSDISTLPQIESVVMGRPTYVDAGQYNYRLTTYSLGVDFAPTDTTNLADLDNQPRTVNLPGVTNLFGIRDLGAYERQRMFDCGAADTIFCNEFESP